MHRRKVVLGMNLNKIIKNASYLFVGNIGIRLITAASTIFLARFLGPKDFGVYAIASAIAIVAGYFGDLGLTETFIREVNRKESNVPVLLGSYIKIRILLAIVTVLFTYVFIRIFYNEASLLYAITWIVFPIIIGNTFQGTTLAYFQSREQMAMSSILVFFQGMLSALTIFIAIYLKWSFSFFVPIYGCSFLFAGLCSFLLLLNYTTIRKGWDKGLFNQLVAFTINGIIIMLLPQIGPIVLEKVASLSTVGYFSTAYKIPSVLYQIPGVIATAFYPGLFTLGNNKERVNHRNLSKVELKLMSFVGIGISLPFILFPDFWISHLLGGQWGKASTVLAIVSYMVVLQSINYPLADYLTTKGQQFKRMTVMAFGGIVGILGYTLLGRYYGLMGAAVVPILIESALLIGFCCFVYKSISFVYNSVKFNVLSFLICIFLAKWLPIKFPLISMMIVGLSYLFIVLLLDKTLFNKGKIIIQKKLRLSHN